MSLKHSVDARFGFYDPWLYISSFAVKTHCPTETIGDEIRFRYRLSEWQ